MAWISRWGVQYVNYMKSLLHGDLGLSLRQRGRTVNQIIASKLPVSCRLAGIAVVVALCVGIPLGCISAYNRGKWLDNIIIVFCYLRHRDPQLYLQRAAFVPVWYEHEGAAHRWPEQRSRLYHAGHRTGHLPLGIYHPSDALQPAGRHGSGLYAHCPRKGRVPVHDPVPSTHCATPSCLSSPTLAPCWPA